ncbi:hypothetical protein GAYE_SCF26G4600 [Galdieria yellowstonensis]|uniref:proline--tRNA ligase n=1 Tax=Galdieria yellowstonensis TaxID=3028027 RepID=A0AAV9IH97_9RHOD|nr:hypothetical protein GAYE_SCF26G4600 [Galdieria yellowstonensis]
MHSSSCCCSRWKHCANTCLFLLQHHPCKTSRLSSSYPTICYKRRPTYFSKSPNALRTFCCLTTDASYDKITPRSEDYSNWYLDIIQAAQLADQSAVKGCLVIRPYGFAIWELLRDSLDRLIKDTGAQNAYFPIFIPQSFLSKEAEHVEGFAKECAIVTHHRLVNAGSSTLIPDPEAKLEEPLIVRPTSETMVWNMFQKWIHSYRDLPLCINQWANVVRWELRTRPFLRTTEFLWQEGHTAHATAAEAMEKAQEMLRVYSQLCEDILAIPVVKGVKSPSERFAGAEETWTIEAMMQNGWALQSGTSHFLGQNFAKAFQVYFTDAAGREQLVWATSWGASTRLLGALIMTHSDDKGLVLPPKVAPIQVVIVPIYKSQVEEREQVLHTCQNVLQQLKSSGIRVKLDDRDYIRPGSKYFEWERKGVPIRIEIGPKDVHQQVVTVVCRQGERQKKWTLPNNSSLSIPILQELENIQQFLFQQAKSRLDSKTFSQVSFEEMKRRLLLGDKDAQGFFLVPWKCDAINEERIKEETKATLRCYPLQLQHLAKNAKCFYSGEPATHMAIFARAY